MRVDELKSSDYAWRAQQEKKLETANYYRDRNEHPEYYPTPEQHKGAMMIIQGVLDGKITLEKGQELMTQTMAAV